MEGGQKERNMVERIEREKKRDKDEEKRVGREGISLYWDSKKKKREKKRDKEKEIRKGFSTCTIYFHR